jgi:hypothetical protein
MFTCLPGPELEAFGLTPQWRVPIKATEILLTINGRTLHTTCLFCLQMALDGGARDVEGGSRPGSLELPASNERTRNLRLGGLYVKYSCRSGRLHS